MAFKRHVEVSTEDLRVEDIVVMFKGGHYKVRNILQDGRVEVETLTRPIRSYMGRRDTWTVLRAPESVDTSNHLTVQEYLLGCGIEPERLQTAAKTFGSVLSAHFRKRHGKDAERVRKLEYVPYLDVQEAGPESGHRTRDYGWYESLAYAPEDRDLMDEVRAVRLPSLGPYRTPVERAIEVLEVHGLAVDLWPEAESPGAGERLLWLAEEQMKRCAASGQVCGHEACSRRRGARWRGAEERAEGDMFE